MKVNKGFLKKIPDNAEAALVLEGKLPGKWLVAGMHGAAFFASGQGGAGQKKIFWGCSRVGNSQTRGIFGVGRAGTVLKIFGAGPAIFPRARAGLASLVHCAHQLGKSRL